MNALIHCARVISAKCGYKSMNVDLLKDYLIIIIHSGGDSQRCPTLSVCGKVT